jgi:hypothetical protein
LGELFCLTHAWSSTESSLSPRPPAPLRRRTHLTRATETRPQSRTLPLPPHHTYHRSRVLTTTHSHLHTFRGAFTNAPPQQKTTPTPSPSSSRHRRVKGEKDAACSTHHRRANIPIPASMLPGLPRRRRRGFFWFLPCSRQKGAHFFVFSCALTVHTGSPIR